MFTGFLCNKMYKNNCLTILKIYVRIFIQCINISCRNFQIIQKTSVLYRFKSLHFSELKWKSVKRVFFIFRRGIYRRDVENFFNIPVGVRLRNIKKRALRFFYFLIFWIFWKFTQFNFQNCLNNSHNLYLYIVWISEHKFSDNSNNYFYTFYCIKIQWTLVCLIGKIW